MRLFSYIVALLMASALMGCGARQKKEAAAPETDPWAGYKGTFAAGVPTKEELKKADDADKPKKAEAPKAEDAKPTKTASAKKTPESKAAESKVPDVKPVPANDARAMYGEGGDNAAAAEAISGEDAAPAPKKGGKKSGRKAGGGKKAGGAKKNGGAAKK